MQQCRQCQGHHIIISIIWSCFMRGSLIHLHFPTGQEHGRYLSSEKQGSFLCMYRKYENPLMNGGLFSASRGKPHQSTTNQPVKAHWEYTIVQIYNKNPPRLWISAIHYYNPMGFHGDTRIPFGSFWHLPQVPSSWRCLRIVPSSSTRNAQCR